jgi:predicted alpha/beta superfamily hydrolase
MCGRLLLRCAVLGIVATTPAEAQRGSISGDGQSVALPGAAQYDFTSRITGRPYRLTVIPPPHADSSRAYPTLYILDGTAYFATAGEVASIYAVTGQAAPGYVIAIGYQTDDIAVAGDLRSLDLTPFTSPNPSYAKVTGGGDAFLRVIYEEIQPFVVSHFHVDSTRQAIWGHSLGGLLVLRSMLTAPGRFSTYVIASPSINPRVLLDEPSFLRRVNSSGMPLRLLVTVGGAEQAPTAPVGYRGVADASALVERIRSGAPTTHVEEIIFADEGHVPAALSSLIRAIPFAWPATR